MTFLIIMLLIATICVFVWLFLNRNKLNASTLEVIIISITHTIIGVAFVKIFALMESGFDLTKAGSMSLYGGIFFMPIIYFLYAKIKKISFANMLDLFTICLVITFFFARINCLHSGCCVGKYIFNLNYRYPTRELELLFYLIFFLYFVSKVYIMNNNGKVFAFYLMTYGLFRFVCEFFRENNQILIFHIAHLWSLIILMIGLLLLIIIKRKEKMWNG